MKNLCLIHNQSVKKIVGHNFKGDSMKHNHIQINKVTSVVKSQYPNYCCQECGENIGYLGRFFQKITIFNIHKIFHVHIGQNSDEKDRITRKVVGILLIMLVFAFFIVK